METAVIIAVNGRTLMTLKALTDSGAMLQAIVALDPFQRHDDIVPDSYWLPYEDLDLESMAATADFAL